MMAGAGPIRAPMTGSLINFFAPILPRRTGVGRPDAPDGQFHDRRHHARPTSRTPTRRRRSAQAMPPQSAELKVTDAAELPEATDQLCGFDGRHGRHHLRRRGQLRHVHDHPGAGRRRPPAAPRAGPELQVRRRRLTSRRSSATPTISIATTNQLMQVRRLDRATTPLVDNVVDLQFDYFGDPNPPSIPKARRRRRELPLRRGRQLPRSAGAAADRRLARGAARRRS